MGRMKDVAVRRLKGRIWIKEVVQRRVQFERVIVGMRMMMGLRVELMLRGRMRFGRDLRLRLRVQMMIGLGMRRRMRLRTKVVIEGMIELMMENEREKRLGMIDYG